MPKGDAIFVCNNTNFLHNLIRAIISVTKFSMTSRNKMLHIWLEFDENHISNFKWSLYPFFISNLLHYICCSRQIVSQYWMVTFLYQYNNHICIFRKIRNVNWMDNYREPKRESFRWWNSNWYYINTMQEITTKTMNLAYHLLYTSNKSRDRCWPLLISH